jgi:hypothetical protein
MIANVRDYCGQDDHIPAEHDCPQWMEAPLGRAMDRSDTDSTTTDFSTGPMVAASLPFSRSVEALDNILISDDLLSCDIGFAITAMPRRTDSACVRHDGAALSPTAMSSRMRRR